ncbi:type IV secretion protein VblB5 [Bartonella krasnovii]|uniref:Type IV secretion protein VblB5 n=1 Tax=Bartonella krasnovii TaxID=2267275 RepID=A0A5B9D330_9HYPH|nr:type IV secretion system protein [Bartonella krasnovii]QEE12770.1 type IV secretion protein VblB5 [Bartonella krasnovii]UNF53478.1 type IV secretion protein VblB5 [Bartonella krasnovii]
MKKLLWATAFCAISLSLKTNALAAMPTFDLKSYLQGGKQLQKLEKQIQQGTQQLKNLEDQLNQMKQLYSSLNAKPDISALKEMFNKQGSNGALPSDFNHFQQSMGSGGGGGGGGSTSKNAQKWEEELKYKEPSGGAGSKEAVDAFYAEEVKKAEQRVVGQAATGQDVYEEASETQKEINKLLDKLGNTEKAGEIQGIQAKLEAIQAKLQTQVLQMQAAAMIQQAEEKAAERREMEEFKARYKALAQKLRGQ